MGDSAYSFSLTTFSRTGKLLQIEYALNAVANGRTSLGICTKDGVVIATDKKFQSSLVDSDDVRKVERVNDGTGFVYSGVGPDYRVLGEFMFSPSASRITQRRTLRSDGICATTALVHLASLAEPSARCCRRHVSITPD